MQSTEQLILSKRVPKLLARSVDLTVITNDLVTDEDAERLRRSGLLDPD
ncbi:MAG: urease accessory protein UreG, partial [Pseudomonadota bacterium]